MFQIEVCVDNSCKLKQLFRLEITDSISDEDMNFFLIIEFLVSRNVVLEDLHLVDLISPNPCIIKLDKCSTHFLDLSTTPP